MHSPRVVVIEDSILLADHLTALLGHWGFAVVSVVTTSSLAGEATDLQQPDLVVLDLDAAPGPAGLESAMAVRRKTPAPIVYLASSLDPLVIAQLDGTSPCVWVTKPVCDHALRSSIEETLARHRVESIVVKHRTWIEAALRTTDEATIAVDTDGKVVFLSDDVAARKGLSRSLAIARAVNSALRQPNHLDAAGVPTARQVPPHQHSIVTLGSGSRLFWSSRHEAPIDCQLTPIRGTSGEVTGSVVTFRDARQPCASGQRLVRMALHDPLTGLANRSLFFERLRQAAAQSRRNNRAFAVMMVDLDHFKLVNDSLGHAGGDAVLVEAASRLRGCVRETDTVARIGGDELALIQVDLDGPDGAVALADKLLAALSAPIVVEGSALSLSASIGITVCTGDGEAPEETLRAADNALYCAKSRGRGRYAFASPSLRQPDFRMRVAPDELRRALDRAELETYLQPTFSLPHQRLTGAEALVRWNHPVEGVLPASLFIAAAERHGMIESIVHLSLSQACSAAASWLAHRSAVPVSINLPTVSLDGPELVTTIENTLRDTNLPPGWLEVEVCGRLVPARVWDELLPTLRRLSELGIAIALDSFGRDPWSLLVLGMLPVAKVKIDPAMLHGVPDDPRATRLLEGTIGLLGRLGVEVVAVGVETEDQVQWLRQAGCDQAQGHRLGRPMQIGTFYSEHVGLVS